MIMIIFYQATIAPFRIAFLNFDDIKDAYVIFEIFIEVFFFLDIIF